MARRDKTKQNYVPTKGSQGKASSNPQNRTPSNRQSRSVSSKTPPVQIPLNTQANQGAPVQWPGMNPSGRPYPEMPEADKDKSGHAEYPLLDSIGAPGTAIFAGIISSEEYNPDFFWRDGTKIFEMMLRSDAQINAVRNMVELPIRRATVAIEPASEEAKDKEIASFVESCLFHDMVYTTSEGRQLTQKWDDILRQILLYVWHGFMPFEKVWKVEDGWVKLARLLPLLPRTLWRWWVGEDNELVGVQQWTFKQYTYQFSNVPAEKILLFTHRQEGQNFEGISELRPIYMNWYFKQQFLKIQAVAVERNAIVPPVVHLPAGHTAVDVKYAQAIASNMRANELMGVTLPFGWDVEYPKNQQRYAIDMNAIIEYMDVQIARSLLCQFLNLGSKETGSYALADTQVQTFLNALQTIVEYIEDVLNTDLIPELVDYNYDDVETYPKVKFSKMQADITLLANLLKSLSGNKPLIEPYDELMDWITDQLGIPAAPTGIIERNNPTAPSDPMRPDTGIGGPGTNIQSQNIPGKNEQQATNQTQSKEQNVPSQTNNLTEDIEYLRMCYEAIDAVAQGEEHMMLYNPAHYPPGPRGGQFAPKGSSGGGGSARRARATQTAHTRQLIKAKAEAERYRKENEALKAGKANSASSKSGQGGNGKTSAKDVIEEHTLTPIRTGIQRGEFDPSAPPSTNFLHQMYGTYQLPQALSRYSAARLKETAAKENIDLKGARSKEEIAQRIAEHAVIRDGHIGPRTTESTKLERSAKARTEATTKSSGGKSGSRATELPKPIKEISTKSINPYDPHSPEQTSLLHQSYGTAQIGQVLRSFTMSSLREIGGRLGITKLGSSKAKAAETITKELIRRDGHIGPRTAESTALEQAAKGG